MSGPACSQSLTLPAACSSHKSLCSQTLVSVSTVGTLDKMSEADLVKSVQRELKEWFGPEASTWVFMRNYRIPYAQPNQV